MSSATPVLSAAVSTPVQQLLAEPPADWNAVLKDLSRQLVDYLQRTVRAMQLIRGVGTVPDVTVDYHFRRKCAEVVGKWTAIAKLCFQLQLGFRAPARWVVMTDSTRCNALLEMQNPEVFHKFYVFDAYIGWLTPEDQFHGFPQCDAVLRNAQYHGRYPCTEYVIGELVPYAGLISRRFRFWRRTMLAEVVPYVNAHTTPEYANFEVLCERYNI